MMRTAWKSSTRPPGARPTQCEVCTRASSVTVTCWPLSSQHSRTTASRGSSPGSIPPPGRPHWPGRVGPVRQLGDQHAPARWRRPRRRRPAGRAAAPPPGPAPGPRRRRVPARTPVSRRPRAGLGRSARRTSKRTVRTCSSPATLSVARARSTAQPRAPSTSAGSSPWPRTASTTGSCPRSWPTRTIRGAACRGALTAHPPGTGPARTRPRHRPRRAPTTAPAGARRLYAAIAARRSPSRDQPGHRRAPSPRRRRRGTR